MTTLAPPALPRPDAPAFSVWDVIAAHPELAGMTRPEPRPCEPLPYCMESTALAVWDEITGPHVTSITVAATYPEWRVVREDGGVSFPSGSDVGIPISPGVLVPESKPAPEIPPVPLPAAGVLLICAVVALPFARRMTR